MQSINLRWSAAALCSWLGLALLTGAQLDLETALCNPPTPARTWELAGHPPQGDRWGADLNLPAVQKYEAICHVFQLRLPRSPQRVLDGEVLHVFLQRVVQGANLAVLPQLVQHQRREDFGQAGDSGRRTTTDRVLLRGMSEVSVSRGGHADFFPMSSSQRWDRKKVGYGVTTQQVTFGVVSNGSVMLDNKNKLIPLPSSPDRKWEGRGDAVLDALFQHPVKLACLSMVMQFISRRMYNCGWRQF